MGLSEKAKQNKAKYNMKYKKEHYKQIPLQITFDKYEEIKLSAEKHGEKVNTYIKIAIDERLSRDNDQE